MGKICRLKQRRGKLGIFLQMQQKELGIYEFRGGASVAGCTWELGLAAWQSSSFPGWLCGERPTSWNILLPWGFIEPFFFFFFSFLLKYSCFTLLCQFLLHSKMTQSYMYMHSFCYIIFHRGPSQETVYSSLCCTVGPNCLSILNVIVCFY